MITTNPFRPKTLTLASAKARKAKHRYESPNRAVEYLDAIDTLELAVWMAMKYDEPENRAVRRCAKAIMMRTEDWKVRAILDGVVHSDDPAMMVLKLSEDLMRHLDDNDMSRQDAQELGSKF